MRRIHRFGVALVLAAALALAQAVPAKAAVQGTIIGLDPDRDNLFTAMSDMMPGDSVTDVFTVQNLGSTTCIFYLQAESAAEMDFDNGARDLRSCEALLGALEMSVTVHADGQTEVYNGLANQVDCADDHVAMIGRRIELDVLEPGEIVQIEATVTVPDWVDNAHSGAQGKFWWRFYSEEIEAQNPAVSLISTGKSMAQRLMAPQTGDDASLLPWLILLGASALLLLGLFYVLKKRGRD